MEDFSSSDEYTSDSEEDTVDFDEAFLRMKPCTGHYHKAKPKVVDYIDRLTDQAIGLFWIGKLQVVSGDAVHAGMTSMRTKEWTEWL